MGVQSGGQQGSEILEMKINTKTVKMKNALGFGACTKVGRNRCWWRPCGKTPPGLESEQNLVFRQVFRLGLQVSVALINSFH